MQKALAAPGRDAIKAELQRRGVDLSGVNVQLGGEIHHPGLRGIGESLAPILKVAAPIAALAIPGLGPIAAGAIAAGGNLAGNALQGKNTLQALPGAALGGLAVGAGRGLLNSAIGGGYAGQSGAPAGAAAGGGGGLAAVGNAGSGGGGGGIGGTLQGIGQSLGVLGPSGQLNPLRLAQLGLGVAGTIQGAQAQGRANDALGRAVAPVNVAAPNLSSIFSDPSNPYMNQGGPNGAQLAALRALGSR